MNGWTACPGHTMPCMCLTFALTSLTMFSLFILKHGCFMFPCLCKEEVRGWRPVALAALPPTPHLGPATSGHLPPLATSGHLGRLGEALWWRTRSAVPPPLPPATDHLLGSYVPTAEWQPKMRPLPANAQTRGPVVAPANVPQLPTREEYEATRRLQRHSCERRLCTAAPLGRRRGCCRGRCASRPAAAAARRRRQSQTGARSLRTPTASDLLAEKGPPPPPRRAALRQRSTLSMLA